MEKKRSKSRRRFFQGIALGTIGLPFAIRSFSPNGYAQDNNSSSPNIITRKKYEWNLVTTWPPNFPVLGEGCNHLAEWINVMSEGQLKIKVYGGGELVPALGVFDAVKNGSAEMGSGAAYYWAGKIPSAQFFASVPFGMNAQQMNAWLLGGGGLKLWEEVYGSFGLLPMVGGNTGVQMGGWFNKKIEGPSDLQGLKMRIPGLGGKVLEEAGGTPVLLAGGELFTGLERGIIDATEWIGPYHDYKMGFHEIAKYYYYPGWHEPGSVLEIICNKVAFEKLPAHLKAIIRAAVARMNHWILSEFEAKNSIYLKKIRAHEKVEILPFDALLLNHLKEVTADILSDFASTDPTAKKVYNAFLQFRKQARDWNQLSEQTFYSNLS